MYVLYLCDLYITVLAPPLNVRASQSGSESSPVMVSWSPAPRLSASSADSITGYRIFYGSLGQNVTVQASSLTDLILTVRLRVNAIYVGKIVSIRSEADQLYSELVNVSVSLAGESDSYLRCL